MDKDTLNALYAPFDLKERVGLGGMVFKYIPSDQIIDRMNKVFGGSWSTEVQSQEVIEDSVLLRVNVRVWDKDNWYSHEGYGASSFKRFNSGPNQGKIIDVGNAYKAALSMAIRNACSRFGCGLHLEGDPEHDLPSAAETNSGPEMPKFDLPKTEGQKTLDSQSGSGVPNLPKPKSNLPSPDSQSNPQDSQSSKPAGSIPPFPPGFGGAKQSLPDSQSSAPVQDSQSETPVPKPQDSQSQNVPPKVQDSQSPSMPNTFTPQQQDSVSTVQEAALEALIDIKGLDYETLVKEAFDDAGISYTEIPPKDKLKGSEATVIIKYGNDKARR